MQVEKLSNNLSELVDLLRSEERYPATLTDVASIAEVLIKCMERYFASIDTTMYGEIQRLAGHIKQARLEIGRARPNEITANRIPRAGKELDEIVRATEEATNSIMASAESIMSVDSSNDEAKAEIDAACMNIFEACSFQDVTGQRISKVVKTLDFIDERLGSLLGAVDGVADEPPPDAALAGDDALLHGPQLSGEGITQDDVDSMFDSAGAGRDAATDAPPVAAPEPVAASVASDVVPEIAAAPPAPAAPPVAPTPAPEPEPVAASQDEPPPTADVPVKSNDSAKSSQAEIDALFD